jgi:hypothetical protein
MSKEKKNRFFSLNKLIIMFVFFCYCRHTGFLPQNKKTEKKRRKEGIPSLTTNKTNKQK